MSRRRYGRYSVDVSREDKILFPRDGITKGDLVDYYHRIADRLLPWIEDRPLVMQRFPDGIDEDGFYHKQVPGHFPDWVTRQRVPVSDGEQDLVVCDNRATLAVLADQGCITLHPWLSRRDRLDNPDLLVIDLDPPGDDFAPVRRAALCCRDLLEEVGLVPFVKTTGSSGAHVVAPLDRSAGFDAVRRFARDLARVLAARFPDELTTAQRRNRRGGRLFLDVGRNAYGQTAVAPYAVRARDGAPVATPIDWDELPRVTARTYRIDNVLRRLGQRDDPWSWLRRRARSLDDPRRRLARLLGDDA